MQISKEEYEKLMDASDKLAALENGGVDNWTNYDDALEEYNDKKDLKDKLKRIAWELLEELGELVCEPAGARCGYAIGEKGEADKLVLDCFNQILTMKND